MRDRVKRMLGFVLVATIDGPPRSPRQTHFRAQDCNRGSATATGSRSPAFHSSRVAAIGHRDSFPKCHFTQHGIDSCPGRVFRIRPQVGIGIQGDLC